MSSAKLSKYKQVCGHICFLMMIVICLVSETKFQRERERESCITYIRFANRFVVRVKSPTDVLRKIVEY